MDMEAKIRAAWSLNVFKLLEVLGIELLFHRPIRRVKIKISSKSVGPVVLIFFSIGESEGSKSNKKIRGLCFLRHFSVWGVRKKME